MSACLCETPQPTKKRRQRASRRMLRDSCVRFPCQRVSAAFRCVPGGSPDAVGAARGGPGAPTEPPGRGMACLRSVPRARPGTACDGFCLPDWAPRGVLERLGLDFGLSGKVRVVSWDAFRVRFLHVLAFRVTPCLRACDSVRPTKRKKKKWRFRFRPAFGCSCSPARLPRLFP